MFQRLYELSRLLPEREPWQRLNEGMPPNYDRGLAICFDQQGNWTDIKTVFGNKEVVYRSGPPNSTDLTPCCKLAGSTADRLLKAVGELADYGGLSADKKAWLKSTIESFERDRDRIWGELQISADQAEIDGKKHRGYIYWTGQDAAEAVYHWPEAKELIVQNFLAPFARGGKRVGSCTVCGQRNQTVYGNFSVLACYNLDKPGSIAGGFSAPEAHRNLPVCEQCALAVAEALIFAQTYFVSSMAGQSYMILPYTNAADIHDELSDSLRRHPDKFRLGNAYDLVAEEMALLDEFQGRGDQLAFYLVFFKTENAAWRIQAEVQQVPPSRIQALHDAGKKIERALDLAIEDKDGIKPLRITALTFKTFSGASKSASEDTLRAWLVALFKHKTIDDQHLLHHLVSQLIATGKANPDFLHWTARQAWGLYRYALLTELILPADFQERSIMSEFIPNSPYGRYIKAHTEFFRKSETVVAFLTGCYASQVASVQRQERNAAPFTKKFIGRLLSRQHLQRLYQEGHDKLAQYDKLSYVITGLDPDLAQAWVACGDQWSLGDEEATFAFTIGYSLAYRIRQLDSQQETPEQPE